MRVALISNDAHWAQFAAFSTSMFERALLHQLLKFYRFMARLLDQVADHMHDAEYLQRLFAQAKHACNA